MKLISAQPASSGYGYGIASLVSGFGGHRFCFAPEDGSGGGVSGAGAVSTASEEISKPVENATDDAANKSAKSSMTDAEAKLLKDVMRQKDAAKKASDEAKSAREAKAQLEARVSELLNLSSVDELEERLSAIRKDEEARLAATGEFEKLKERLVSDNKKEVERLQGLLNQKTGDLSKKLDAAESTIRNLMVSTKFAASEYVLKELVISPHHVERLYGDRFKVELDENGERVVNAYGTDGAVLKDDAGKPLSFDEALVKIINADPGKDSLFRPKAKPGAGSLSSGGVSTVVNAPAVRGVQRIAAGLAAKT